ncbi:MAG: DoxX family protein [Polyangiaceae bacterium]|nr:DoxX family protein [Polyangiaceae bacterium]
MKARTIGYWVTTVLVALAFAAGGAGDLSHGPDMVAGMAHLGYPVYFLTILGIWKVLGALAIVVPKFPRLKEWAYAGMIFDLTGAAASHAASGDDAGKVITPLVIGLLVAASWALRPAARTLKPLFADAPQGASTTKNPALA